MKYAGNFNNLEVRTTVPTIIGNISVVETDVKNKIGSENYDYKLSYLKP